MASKELKIKVVDLFCGIGGLTHGLFKEGLEVVAGYDIDEDCRYAYEANNDCDFVAKDIKEVTSKEIKKLYTGADVSVLVGCAPCQPFSTYSFKTQDKNKWRLLNEFGRLIQEVKPDIVSMENVPRLASFKKEPVFHNFLDLLSDSGYKYDYNIVNCAEFGVPQNRKRLVLVASRIGEIKFQVKKLKPEKFKTVKDAIGKIAPITHGQTHEKDRLHRSAKLNDINLKRIKQSVPGGSWKDWDEELLLACHKRDSGKSYVSVYGRMQWDKPSPTITTHCTGIGNGRFGHPDQDRGISLREAAILQSFPKKYKLLKSSEKLQVRTLSRHIGNAVPVKLGRAIGKCIKSHINDLHND